MKRSDQKTSTKAKVTPRKKAAAAPHIIHHRDGSLSARGQMLGGRMHGFWSFFRKDGSIMRSGSFDRGAQTGTWTTFSSDGRPLKVTEMKPRPGAPRAAKPRRATGR